MTLMPCFGPKQAFAEGILVGRILAGYGELELEMCACIAAITDDIDSAVKLIFRNRGAERRIQEADKAMAIEYAKASLRADLTEILADMDWCRQIRNQYAHSNWYWTSTDGLCFVDLEAAAKITGVLAPLATYRKSLTVPLLQQQEDYCNYVKENFWYLRDAYLKWAGKLSTPPFAKPPKILRPLKHN